MTNELRVVFDTNVLVSATLLPRSVPRRAVNAASECGIVLFSEESLAEFDEVICRPKFDRYVRESNRKEFLASVLEDAESIEVIDSISDCRDPKDNKFLELAVSGDATHLVTGDDDLLVLHPFRGVSILTPQAFLDEFSLDSAGELKS